MRSLLLWSLLAVALAIILISYACSHNDARTILNISVRNDSANDLTWVKLEWAGMNIGGGILGKGKFSTDLLVPIPQSPPATAKLRLVDNNPSDQKTPLGNRPSYEIIVDVSPLRNLGPGEHNFTVSILSHTEAKLLPHGPYQ